MRGVEEHLSARVAGGVTLGRRRFAPAWGAALALMVGCGAGGSDEGTSALDDVDLDAPIPQTAASPLCVWNQAYQENTDPDAVADILAGASGCYVLLDPFDSDAAREAIPALVAAGNTVGCYISVGTCEEWREDYAQTRPHCAQQEWDEWEGEYFVADPTGVLPLMQARVDALADFGCQMVELDNMDWAEDQEALRGVGASVTPEAGAAYVEAVCAHAHQRGLGCMAKNLRLGGPTLFDGGTFESYPDELDWWEHDHLQSFVDQGRPAVVIHYGERDCARAAAFYRQRYGAGVSFLCEDVALGGYRR